MGEKKKKKILKKEKKRNQKGKEKYESFNLRAEYPYDETVAEQGNECE